MCGLIAMVAKQQMGFTKEHVGAFAQLLYAGQLRGVDGTGMFYAKKGKAVRIIKAPEPSSFFMSSPAFGKGMKEVFDDARFVVGHNRAATKGTIDFDCTHPFNEGNITLVHNGTLWSHKDLYKDAKVDSHAICHSINEIGYKETLKKVDGAFALIWYDSSDKKLRIARNDQRPLYIIEGKQIWILVSELEMGLWIMKRNQLEIIKSEEVRTERVYSFDMEKPGEYEWEVAEYYKWTAKGNLTSCWDNWDGVGYQPTKKSIPTRPPNTYKKFSFGEKIRFKATELKMTVKDQLFLEGVILKFQTVLPSNIIEDDWEDKPRIRIFAGEKELEDILAMDNPQGTLINSFTIKGDNYLTYQLNNVSEYVPKNVVNFPAVTEKLKEPLSKFTCGVCNHEFDVVGMKKFNGLEVCGNCLTTLVYSG